MSISNWRAREKQQRKDDILDASEKLFFSKGYDNISMNDIAKEVGLNRATIYLYFDNKEELCLVIVLRGVQILNKLIKNQVKTATHSKKIYAFGSAYALFFQSYPQYVQVYNLFQSGRFDLSSLKRPSWDHAREIIKLQEEMFDILFSAIKTELHGQKISSEVDPTYATILILSTLDTLLNPSPIIKKELNNIKINEYQDFKRNFIQFINKLLYK